MLKIVVGCYEQIVLGYTIKPGSDGESLESSPYFTDHSQKGCIKCASAGGRYVATGSTDETICLYDMQKGTELGTLQGHSGAITQLLFPDDTHLMSCSEDGSICIWEAGPEGTLLKTLHGHKGAVTAIAAHPSGKLGMSVSPKDGSLRTWNLMTGRSVFIKNMKKFEPEFIRWSYDGKYYVVASLHEIQVFELESAKCILESTIDEQILALEFLPVETHHMLAIGDGSGNIQIINIHSEKCRKKFKAHESRVKCINIIKPQTQQKPDEMWLTSGSSDGNLKIWRLNNEYINSSNKTEEADCLLSIQTNARVTCLTVWQEPSDSKTLKDANENNTKNRETTEGKNKDKIIAQRRKRKQNQRLNQKKKLQKLLGDE
uniref:p21-activated protein kinase-interacting protein 1-like n=1 Tax=Phallusia mammillata TaxID=59560 RepID=A0A6F9DMH3_9ASCI|nr:p21-activated protein kinase-interacting protein 1-like [Phallusia mammillata]